MHIFAGILIFKGLAARRLCKSFGVKGLSALNFRAWCVYDLFVYSDQAMRRSLKYVLAKYVRFRRF
jgi:hypothetical protein